MSSGVQRRRLGRAPPARSIRVPPREPIGAAAGPRREVPRRRKDAHVGRLLDEQITSARRCRPPSFVKLAKTIKAQRVGILVAIKHGRSNARVEAINTQIRVITRRAYGFHSASALIALAMLSLGGLCPPLPR